MFQNLCDRRFMFFCHRKHLQRRILSSCSTRNHSDVDEDQFVSLPGEKSYALGLQLLSVILERWGLSKRIFLLHWFDVWRLIRLIRKITNGVQQMDSSNAIPLYWRSLIYCSWYNWDALCSVILCSITLTIFNAEVFENLVIFRPTFSMGRKIIICVAFFSKFCQISTLHHLTHHCRWWVK